ncbi:LOW QUALITY PROTEIN: hypothetical protein PanWU01x14_186840 [Parasponia andersonii]|uniref:Uncharacterized protein n=1 Tax=Parasponia andersonii TaxID=3476 RepID=A0A2P5C3K7_PARAD|nr:LOW QUALITY PROTEIN: hypothetical protein PanWU01x14_186840 [Parasponia andersonii]
MLRAVLFYPRLNPIITNVPLDELPQPGGQVRSGLVPEVPERQAHVRVRVRDVAVPRHLDHVPLRLDAQELEDRDQPPHGDRRRVPEVVDPQLGGAPLLAAAPGALLGRVEGPKAPLHDVVYVREVTRHLLLVLRLIHFDGLAAEDVLGEEEVGHVGPAPGSIHREEPQARQGEPVDVVVRVGYLLPGLLRGGVEAGRLVRAVELGEGVLGVEPVDRARRGPDDGGLRVGGLGHLQEADEAGDVGSHVRLGVLHCIPDARLGRQVEHVREGDDVEELGEERRVVQVPVDDEDLVPGQEGLAGPLQRGVVVVIEVVEAEHAVAPLFQGEGAVRPDEAGGAGHQDGHSAGAARGGRVADLLLPGGAADPAAVEGGGEEVVAGVEAAGVAVGVVGEGWVVEGEEEDEDEGDEECGAEEELGGSVKELGAVDSSQVAVVAL